MMALAMILFFTSALLAPRRALTAAVACVVTTFRWPATPDAPKVQARRNVARMFRRLEPHIHAFLGVSHASANEIALWRAEGHTRVLYGIESNAHGTPLLRSLLQRAERACPASASFIAFANADLLLDTSLVHTLRRLLAWPPKNLVVVGQRLNLDVQRYDDAELLYATPDGFRLNTTHATSFRGDAQDYFVFSRPLLADAWPMPDFVIGRIAYDNAVVDWAYHHACLVDATATITAVHQSTRDGNAASHSMDKADRTYNLQLPGVVFDHAFVGFARYETAPGRAPNAIEIVDRTEDLVPLPSVRAYLSGGAIL